LRAMRNRPTVGEIMTKDVLTIGPESSVMKAAKLMASRSVGSIVVVQRGKPVGILTERDLLMKIISADMKPSKVPIRKVMSSPVITTTPETDLVEAVRIMARHHIRRLPVVDGGKLVGIITTRDVMKISPELLEVNMTQPAAGGERIEESVCEVCGELTTHLYEVNGMWVCESCRDDMER